jgi:eukaryotic-like serine/threonine-protein kinase
VPGGEFTMGSTIERDEMPEHIVEVDDFWIGQTEVTNDQYSRCVAAGVCTPPRNTFWQETTKADHPVTNVDWSQARTYAFWVGGRLPTEAEWEKAARGADSRTFPWADKVTDEQRLNFNFLNGGTVAVGSHPLGASPYGALDMAGNVEEWVADWYAPDYYTQSPRRNPLGPGSGLFRGVRGGSFNSGRGDVRAASRGRALPDTAFDSVGFRVVVPGL